MSFILATDGMSEGRAVQARAWLVLRTGGEINVTVHGLD